VGCVAPASGGRGGSSAAVICSTLSGAAPPGDTTSSVSQTPFPRNLAHRAIGPVRPVNLSAPGQRRCRAWPSPSGSGIG